jgi:putative OmpL-like beta-barrel porin-2
MTCPCRAAVCSVSLSLAAAASVAAQDPQPQATPEPSPSPGAPPKVQVTGFVDVYYEYNFNHVDPLARTFDVQHNAFSLSLAEVAFAKVPSAESRLGFRADLDFGKTAEIVASFEPSDTDRQLYQYVQQAYISVLAGSRVQLDAGKFVTPAGAEVIESQDNWNYTRSILFGYAIPFYHFGVRATVPVTSKLSLAGYVVNGWNNGAELDGAKAFVLSGTAKPKAAVTWVGNYIVGREAQSLPTRNLVDTTLTVTATPKLSFMGNVDYGKEGEVRWWGAAAYARFQVTPSWAFAARYEYVDDTKGGFMTFGTKVQSVTLTTDHTIAGALKARLEYRTDFAAVDIFETDSGSHRGSQTTLAVGLVCSFGGSI